MFSYRFSSEKGKHENSLFSPLACFYENVFEKAEIFQWAFIAGKTNSCINDDGALVEGLVHSFQHKAQMSFQKAQPMLEERRIASNFPTFLTNSLVFMKEAFVFHRRAI